MDKWVGFTIYLDEPFTFQYSDKKPEDISLIELTFLFDKDFDRVCSRCSLIEGHHHFWAFDEMDKKFITLFKFWLDIDLYLDTGCKDLNLMQTARVDGIKRSLYWHMKNEDFDSIMEFLNKLKG